MQFDLFHGTAVMKQDVDDMYPMDKVVCYVSYDGAVMLYII